MERFTNRLLNQAKKDIDPQQYARHGHSTQALIYLIQALYEAIDISNCSTGIFFMMISLMVLIL